MVLIFIFQRYIISGRSVRVPYVGHLVLARIQFPTQFYLVIIFTPSTVATTLAFGSDPRKASSTTSMQSCSSWLRVPLVGDGVRASRAEQSMLGSHVLRFTRHKILRRPAALSGMTVAVSSFCQTQQYSSRGLKNMMRAWNKSKVLMMTVNVEDFPFD